MNEQSRDRAASRAPAACCLPAGGEPEPRTEHPVGGEPRRGGAGRAQGGAWDPAAARAPAGEECADSIPEAALQTPAGGHLADGWGWAGSRLLLG